MVERNWYVWGGLLRSLPKSGDGTDLTFDSCQKKFERVSEPEQHQGENEQNPSKREACATETSISNCPFHVVKFKPSSKKLVDQVFVFTELL
jgi:hypothetical protein